MKFVDCSLSSKKLEKIITKKKKKATIYSFPK